MQLIEETKANLKKRVPRHLQVLMYPALELKQVSQHVLSDFSEDREFQNLLQDLEFTCKKHQAAGISAIQVGIPIRAIVVKDKNGNYLKMVNPAIKSQEGASYELEGCLSFPFLFTKIRRPGEITVTYQDEFGNPQELWAREMLCREILHEIDHLDGKTFLDRMNFIQKEGCLRKFKNLKRKLKSL